MAGQSNSQKSVNIQVQGDYLERLAQCSAPKAIAELIWNSLDADASKVDVVLTRNDLEGLETIAVRDNGTGIAGAGRTAEQLFKRLGGSWKGPAGRTEGKRALHGKAGEGRFRSFALGNNVAWTSQSMVNGELKGLTVSGIHKIPKFSINDQAAVSGAPGTTVTISNLREGTELKKGTLLKKLTPVFALYLQQYPGAQISIEGVSMDPTSVQVTTENLGVLQAELPDDKTVSATLRVIEWAAPMDRAIYLCDEQELPLLELPPGLASPGYTFTAYLSSDYFQKLDNDALLDSTLAPGRELLLDAAKDKLRGYFRRRAAEQAELAVERWKLDDIYPFANAPVGPVEKVERQVFDIVALNLSDQLPGFNKSNPKQKKFAFRLVREALEQNPGALQTIITEVIGLPKEKQDELAGLLQETTLSAIINATKVVTDRLRFLAGLEQLLFDPENKKSLLERKQLHRLLAANTWIFGEQFNLTVDDESLNAALDRHLEQLGRTCANREPVRREDGSEGILDLMLSCVIPLPDHQRREHLVVELKRPSQKVNSKVLQQIEDYAFAVVADERFADTNTTWRFITVSNQIAPSVEKKANQKDRPKGLVYEDADVNMTVWVYSWSQIIEEARTRLEFFRRALDYSVTKESAQSHLQKVYAKYLPEKISGTHDDEASLSPEAPKSETRTDIVESSDQSVVNEGA